MADKAHSGAKKGKTPYKSPLEALENKQGSTVKSTKELKKVGRGIFDQLLGRDRVEDFERYPFGRREEEPRPRKREVKLFNYQEYHEQEIVKREIQELLTQIKQEIETIKKQEVSLLSEVKDVEKATIEQLPEKSGVYHVRFLEVILSILRTVRQKIGESKTWLEALTTKKKKRGSLFMALSKKKGTQYSLSQELQAARSVQ